MRPRVVRCVLRGKEQDLVEFSLVKVVLGLEQIHEVLSWVVDGGNDVYKAAAR